MNEESDKSCSWPKICCWSGFIISVVFYCLAVALSWSCAKRLPVHHQGFALAGAIFVSLPGIAIVAGCAIVCVCAGKLDDTFTWSGVLLCCAFVCGGACTFIGSVFLFLAAALPPLSHMDPHAYSAFAAIAGIMAAIAGIVYCFELSGYAVKDHYDDKRNTGKNANSEG